MVNASGVSVYYEHVMLEVERTSTGGIMVQLKPNELEGVIVRVPDIFKKVMNKEEYAKFVNELLMALRGGLEETDGHIKDDKVGMGTTQIWQVVVWSLLYSGENYVHVYAVNINEDGVTITWHLRTNHKPLKGKILGNAGKLSEEESLAFTFTVVLGDGWEDVVKPIINGRVYDEAVIKITMSGEEFKRWEPLLMQLKSMGFG